MLMMHIGHMGMRVLQSGMPMLMHVGFAGRILRPMGMLMMLIMPVCVLVLDTFVDVFVDVFFAHMQPEAQRHEGSGKAELRRDRVAKKQHRQDASKKWGEGKVRACPRCSELSQRQDEQDEAQSVPEETDRRGPRDRSEARHCIPQAQRKREVDRTGDDALQPGDQDRVAG